MSDPLLPEFNDRDEGEQTEQLDVTEQLTQDRLKAITEARRHVSEVRLRSRVQGHRADTTINELGARVLYREALMNYLFELRPYRDVGGLPSDLWFGFDGDDPPVIGVEVFPEGEENVIVYGLDDILTLPLTFSVTREETVDYPQGPSQELERTETYTLSRETLDDAYGWANDFARRIGLDINVDSKGRRATSDYSDVLNND